MPGAALAVAQHDPSVHRAQRTAFPRCRIAADSTHARLAPRQLRAPVYAPRPAADSFHRGDDTTAWAKAALKGELERLEQAKPGCRNNNLNRVAYKLGQIIAGGQLDEAEVESMLVEGAVSLGLGEREAAATVHSGKQAGEVAPRQPDPEWSSGGRATPN